MLRQTVNSSAEAGILVTLCALCMQERKADSSRMWLSLAKLQLIFCRCLYRRPGEITHLIDILAWCVSYKCSTMCKAETAVLRFLPLHLAASYWFQGSKILSVLVLVLVQISFYWGLGFYRQHTLDGFIFTMEVSEKRITLYWRRVLLFHFY